MAHSSLMPVLFVPHGGGPMPLLGETNHRELTAFMQGLAPQLPMPKAILVISAHWEEAIANVSSAAQPGMLYDYYSFPPESYEFQYPAPGNPDLAVQIIRMLGEKGIPARLNPERDYDHGTFVPLMLMYPAATIPVVQLSLLGSLNPQAHIDLGKAIASLREQGVLIIGSGMSFHNMHAFFSGNSSSTQRSLLFAQWLTQTLTAEDLTPAIREQRLVDWKAAPEARFSHPREEHLLPLHVCFGAAMAASPKAELNFSGLLFNTHINGFIWR